MGTDAQIALSRRAGRLMSFSPICRLSGGDYAAFVNAVSAAASFEALDPKWRGIIKMAEAEFERAMAEKEEAKPDADA